MIRASRALLLLLAIGLVACDSVDRFPEDRPEVEAAWVSYHDAPSHDTYLAFLKINGRAAHDHGEHHDVAGIRFQLRALEVQAAEAVRAGDGEIAWQVVDRLRELVEDGHLELYEEVLPGCRERFESAGNRSKALLDE